MGHIVDKIFLLFKKPFLSKDNEKRVGEKDDGDKENQGKEKDNLELFPKKARSPGKFYGKIIGKSMITRH
jgi:hypothetical protein